MAPVGVSRPEPWEDRGCFLGVEVCDAMCGAVLDREIKEDSAKGEPAGSVRAAAIIDEVYGFSRTKKSTDGTCNYQAQQKTRPKEARADGQAV